MLQYFPQFLMSVRENEQIFKAFSNICFKKDTMTFSIATFSIMALSIMTLSMMILSIMTLSIMTLNLMDLNATLNFNGTGHKN